jgi:hypothetical protein
MASTPWHLLTSTATITSVTWIENSGGIPYGDAPTGTFTVMCMIQPLSAQDALIYGRDTTTQVFSVFMAPTTTTGAAWDVTPRDSISIDSVTYRIVGKPVDQAGLGVIRQLTVEVDTN